MFITTVVVTSVLLAGLICWGVETAFYKSMFGETLDSSDPNFDVYDLAIDNADFELLREDMIHSCDEGSAIRYIARVDISLLKRNFFHIHSKELDDRRVVKGSDLFEKIFEIMKDKTENNVNRRVERMRRFANIDEDK